MIKSIFVKIVYIVICVIVSSQDLIAQDTSFHAEVMKEEIVGVALYPDGKTPVADLPVRVWNADLKKMVYRSKTNNEGVFRIPNIQAGTHFVFIGRVKVNLKVLQPDSPQTLQHHDIVMVVPKGMLVTAGPRMMDILIAPVLMKLPEKEDVVSP